MTCIYIIICVLCSQVHINRTREYRHARTHTYKHTHTHLYIIIIYRYTRITRAQSENINNTTIVRTAAAADIITILCIGGEKANLARSIKNKSATHVLLRRPGLIIHAPGPGEYNGGNARM